MLKFKLTLMQRYILRQFLVTLAVCLVAATTLFLVFDLFERMRNFVKYDATFLQAVQYMLFKIPLIIHLMTPIAVLIATLMAVGQLSQSSEITAMRACGANILLLAKPLLIAGLLISFASFFIAETILPWATQRLDEIYTIDIKKKDQSGSLNREDFWYRKGNSFYTIDLYNSRDLQLNGLTILDTDDSFSVTRRLYANEAAWHDSTVGWVMNNAVESVTKPDGSLVTTHFHSLPLVIEETPKDFYDMKRRAETMSFWELTNYIEKLQRDGILVTRYIVDRAAKISFPFVSFIVVLIGFPFALISARSGTMTMSFVAGISVGFGYYIVHAVSTSFGAAELIPPTIAAWTANILLGSIGAYLMAGADYSR